MDRERFDALARILATSGSRRETASVLVSAILLGQSPAVLADRRGGRSKSRDHHRNDSGEAQDGVDRETNGVASNEGVVSDRGGQTSDANTIDAESRDTDNGPGTRKNHRGGKGKGKGRRRRKPVKESPAPANCFSDGPCNPGPRADLQYCDFTGSNALRGVNCAQSNLQGASLLRADASGASFTNANLGNACLVDADLRGAVFSGGTNLRGATFCRTIMPDGSTNNSGCGGGGRCCPTCIAIGGDCGGAGSGACCGGAACQSGRCACPATNPIECHGVCQQCCGDSTCSGDAPRCCNGVCRQCCAPGDCLAQQCRAANCTNQGTCTYTTVPDNNSGPLCPSPLVCCNGGCCGSGAVCDTRGQVPECCVPEPPAEICNPPGERPRCGEVPNRCGTLVDCGSCPEVTCRAGFCDGESQNCSYPPVQDLTRCSTDTISDGICCAGTCVSGVCCGNANCTGSTNTCTNNTCRCGSNPACPFPLSCCGASPAGTCTDTTRDPSNCGQCGNRCPRGNICRDDPPRCCLYPGATCSYIAGLNRRCCSRVCRPAFGIPLGFGFCD